MADLVRYQMFIDGQWVDAEDGKTFESVNPSTGEAWAKIPEATFGRRRAGPGALKKFQAWSARSVTPLIRADLGFERTGPYFAGDL